MYTPEEERALFEDTRRILNTEVSDLADPAKAIESLRDLIIYHEWKYYVRNNPVLSDFEYDQLYKMLEGLEEMHPDLIAPDSPTQRVSSDLTEDFQSVEHLSPMLSLANSYNAEDLKDFDKSVRKLLGIETGKPIAYTVEPKFDGGSIALVYQGDQLVRGATRGDGRLGDDMTPNARTIRSIPLKAGFSAHNISRIELRGEAIIRKDNFGKINEIRGKEGLPLFANPRNAATGGLRMKDPGDTAKRGIEAFIYQISYVEGALGNETSRYFDTQWDGMEFLQKLGFKVPGEERKQCRSIEEVIEFCAAWEERRDSYPYEIDGMVVKVDRLSYQNEIGSTSHHPRWAIAYKFKAKQATSRLIKVEYQVGKIGSITPVAKLEPVQLAGVTVSSVSLHNEDFITSKDLRINDYVIVERAGDVIPYIVKALEDLRTGDEVPIEFPRYCPINETAQIPLVRVPSEAAWRCPNCTCGAQDLQRIIFHVSKSAMNIDGFGKSIVERFSDEGWVRSMADIYRLDYEKVAQLEGFGLKSATKLKSSIDKAKKNPIHRLLHSLSIHHLGRRASKILAEHINHVLDLRHWTTEQLTAIKDIGPVLAENVVNYFADERNIAMLEDMEALGVNMLQTHEDKPLEVAEDAPFAGKTILFTGTLQKLKRKEAQELAEKQGARNISAVSSNLNILVVGEKAGSKLKKAEALGTVEIMTEDQFLEKVQA